MEAEAQGTPDTAAEQRSESRSEGNHHRHTDACLEYAALTGRAICVVPSMVDPRRQHIDECVRYAATTRKSFCIADCAEIRVASMQLADDLESDRELERQEEAAAAIPQRGVGESIPGGQSDYVVGGPESASLFKPSNEAPKQEESPNMVQVTLQLSEEAVQALAKVAASQVRTPDLQASYMLEQMVGLRPLLAEDATRIKFEGKKAGADDDSPALSFGRAINELLTSMADFASGPEKLRGGAPPSREPGRRGPG